jgi:Asp-tRNA(Asn)/Glu-tRNA(Gln) amidotransferase A subunit family amidase
MNNVCFPLWKSGLIVDEPEKYEGGPVGLQVIGRRFEEEKVLSILEIIAQALGRIE